jgi:hypothetical protein
MGLFRLFVSADDEALYKSYVSLDLQGLSQFTAGDRKTVEFTLLQRDSVNFPVNPWARVNPGDYSPRIGLFKNSDRSQLTYLTTFADDQDNFLKRGVLLLDTPLINAEFASSSADVACTFEIEITDANGYDHTIYRNTSITLKKGFITPLLVSDAPTEITATQSWVKGNYLPKNGATPDNPVTGWYVYTRPGKKRLFVYFDDQGRLQTAKS